MTWNKTDYGDVETIRVPANVIWTPDLVISNLYVNIDSTVNFRLYIFIVCACIYLTYWRPTVSGRRDGEGGAARDNFLRLPNLESLLYPWRQLLMRLCANAVMTKPPPHHDQVDLNTLHVWKSTTMRGTGVPGCLVWLPL